MKAVELIVTKAQMEEHFCFMYADLCKTIIDSWSTKPCTFLMKDIDVVREGNIIPEAAATSNCKEDQNRSMGSFFRNLLLERCQGEFEFDRVAALEKIKNNIDVRFNI